MLDTAEMIESMALLYSQNSPCPKNSDTIIGSKHVPLKFLSEMEKQELVNQVVEHGFPINRIWIFPWYENENAHTEKERVIDIVCGLDETAKDDPLYIEGMLRLDMFDAYEGATVAVHCIWDNALNMTAPNGILPEWAADWTKTA